LRRRAEAALAAGHLYEDADAAIPIYLALSTLPEHARPAAGGLQRALRQLLADGRAAIEAADGDAPAELARARQLAAVARTVDATDAAVVRFLERLDLAERVHALADAGDRALAEGHLGEAGGGAPRDRPGDGGRRPRAGGADAGHAHRTAARPGHRRIAQVRRHRRGPAPSRPAAAHRPAGRPGRGRTARTHHPGRALRHVRAG